MADIVEEEEANKMNVRNIAMEFSPNMTQFSDPLTSLMHAVQVMNFLQTLIFRTLREREEVTGMEGDSPFSSSATSEGEDDMGGGSRESSSDDDSNVDVNDDAMENLDGSQMNDSSVCFNKDKIVEDIEEFFLRQLELVWMGENDDLGGGFVDPSKSSDDQATRLKLSEFLGEAINSRSECKEQGSSAMIDKVQSRTIEDSKEVQLEFVSVAFSSKSESKQEGSSSTKDVVQSITFVVRDIDNDNSSKTLEDSKEVEMVIETINWFLQE